VDWLIKFIVDFGLFYTFCITPFGPTLDNYIRIFWIDVVAVPKFVLVRIFCIELNIFAVELYSL
jgi:hypothetical protein